MDGLKARLSFDAVAYDYDDEYLTIDTDTHTININNVSRLFGVQYDGNSKLIKFRIKNTLSDIQKMQDSIVYINWIDSRGVKGQSIAINKTINNDTCEFSWKVPFDALKNSGVLHFAMSAVMTKNSSSVIDQRWSTQIASVITPDGIYIKSYTPSSEEEDRIAQIYTELSNMINKQNDNLQSQVNSLKEDILKHGVPVEMFGAVGDGITDDTKALQKAFNSEFSTIILSGIYYISETLAISKSIKIYGGGKILCLVKYNKSNQRVPQGSVDKTSIQIIKGVTDVTISNIHIEGYTNEGTAVGIKFMGSNARIYLEHLKIRYFNTCISFSYSWCNQLEDIEFKYYTYAIKFLKTEETDISCYEVSIKDCVFLYKENGNNASYGIYSDGILSNLSINNSAFDSVNRCIEVKRTSFVSLFNCGFERYENILLVRENTDSFINMFGGHSYLPAGITKEDFYITSGTLNCIGVFFTAQTKFVGNIKKITLIGCNIKNNLQ